MGSLCKELRAELKETSGAGCYIPGLATVENKDLGPKQLVEWVVLATWKAGGSRRRGPQDKSLTTQSLASEA